MSRITDYISKFPADTRRYAHDYLRFLRGGGREPIREIYKGVSYPAARKIRLHLQFLVNSTNAATMSRVGPKYRDS